MDRVLLTELGIALALFGGLMLSQELGYRVGRRDALDREAPAGGQMGAIQAATLGLLGLLLAFSFAGAASRYMERQDLVAKEANAIGTALLRAELLLEPHRSALREGLARYLRHRVEISRTLREGLNESTLAEVAPLQDEIWGAARDGVLAMPSATVAVLGPVNEVLDLHAARLAASRKGLPGLVLGLLLLCSAVAMAAIGYGNGSTDRRSLPLTIALAVLVGTALWTTIDLDHPRAGLIRLDDRPLTELDRDLRG